MPASQSRLRTALPCEDLPPPSGSPDNRGEESFVCDLCEGTFSGRAAGRGLLLWTRGEERRYEEPPLCEACGEKLLLGALMQWVVEDDSE